YDAHDAIADRIVRLADVHRPSLAQAFRLDHDASLRLILVSERVAGIRLSELIARASESAVVPDLPAALFVMRRLLTTAGALQRATGITHLGIAPERVVITPRVHVVIVEAALAAAIEARAGGVQPAVRADIARVALAGLSMMLGRPIASDPTSARANLLGEAADVAAIRVGETYASALQSWFEQALAADMSEAFPDFRQAAGALARTGPQREDGGVGLRRTLRAFVQEVAGSGGPADAEFETTRARIARTRQIARRRDTMAPPRFVATEPETTSFLRADAPAPQDSAIAFEPERSSQTP